MNDYHENLIEFFCKNLNYYEKKLGFKVESVKTNIYFPPHTEIDMEFEGEGKVALVEVKSNNNTQGKFLTKQFENYRKYKSEASIYLFMGTKDESLDLDDLVLQKYYPLTN